MSIYGSRQLGRYGHMGNALAAFGGGGVSVFPGGPSFGGSDTPDVWFGTNPNWNQAGFTALSSGVINQAGKNWVALGNAISDADMAFLDTMKSTLAQQIKEVDNWVGAHSVLGYTQTAVDQGLNALRQLQTSVRKIAAYRVAPPAPAQVDSPSPLTQSLPLDLTASKGGINPSYPTNDATSGGSVPVVGGSSDNTLLYVGLGVGALVLLGGGFFLLKKPRAVAGYRRRRRR